MIKKDLWFYVLEIIIILRMVCWCKIYRRFKIQKTPVWEKRGKCNEK
jgi:hypothetical protein